MGQTDGDRLAVLRAVTRGTMHLRQAAVLLHLSYRQTKRVWRRFRDEGVQGLVHKNKGRPSHRSIDPHLREEVLRRYREKYPGLGPTRFAHALAAAGISIDHETLRRWLLDSGLWTLRKCSGRRGAVGSTNYGFGELLCLLTVRGAWLGSVHPPCFLWCLHDRGTGTCLLTLGGEDSAHVPIRLLSTWIERFGIPEALCCPKRYLLAERKHPTLEQQLAGEDTVSVLGAACERLGLGLETLHSSRAGHVLRVIRPLLAAVEQGLRERRIVSIPQANALLGDGIGDALNAQFSKEREAAADFHVPIVDGTSLQSIFRIDPEYDIGPVRAVPVAKGTTA